MCSKNQVFAGQKRQSVHQEGNNALSSRRRNAISCDPSVGDKVESGYSADISLCPGTAYNSSVRGTTVSGFLRRNLINLRGNKLSPMMS